jgi:dolichyl-phosphate beta-glucosyltransferase
VVVTMPPGGQSAASALIEIVVPARNEARRLPDGLAALYRKAAALPVPAAILVVDSASTDATSEVVRCWPAGPVPVRLLRCARPGKGLAVRTGLLATRAPFVGFCDADMATDLSALDVAIGLLAAGNSLVVGSRGLASSVVTNRHSAVRRAGAAVFRAMARQVVPGATDTQCGFKFFSGPLARAAALRLTTQGFAFDIELIALCQRLGATLTEVPVCWRDTPGSTFSVPRHSAAALRDVAAIWLSHRPGRAGAARAVARPGSPVGDGLLAAAPGLAGARQGLPDAGHGLTAGPALPDTGGGVLAAGDVVPGTGQALPTGVTTA